MIELVLSDRPIPYKRGPVLPDFRVGDVVRIGLTAIFLVTMIGVAHRTFGVTSDNQWVHWTFIGLALDTGLGMFSLIFRGAPSVSLWRCGLITAVLQVHLLALAILPGGDLIAASGWYSAMIIISVVSLTAANWLRRPMVIASLAALALGALIAPPPAPDFEWTPAFFFAKIMLSVWLKTRSSNPANT